MDRRGWVGHRSGLDDTEKKKILLLMGLEIRTHGHPHRSKSLTDRAVHVSGTTVSLRPHSTDLLRCNQDVQSD
jgi:hypothetical protein